MSFLRFLAEQNAPIKKMEKLGVELPDCQRCGVNKATVPHTIGMQDYDLCAACIAKPPKWSIPA